MKLVTVLLACTLFAHAESNHTEEKRRAVCDVQPSPGSDQPVNGVVILEQVHGNPLRIEVHLKGFKTLTDYANESEFLHGFHAHEKGNITGSCDSAGGHYNPTNKTHGAPGDTERHVGDFGNLQQALNGSVDVIFSDNVATLFGPHSLIGRSLVVHALRDDLGKGGNANSLLNGNSGKRYACCVIGYA